jgi:hypothetical protein
MRRLTLTGGKDAEWLEVVRLGKCDWRVSDSRVDKADGARLLGYIEQIGRFHYELLRITDPLRWAYVESLAAATAAFIDNTTFRNETFAEREYEAPPPQAFSPDQECRRPGVVRGDGQNVA